jgi:hypothetical protein
MAVPPTADSGPSVVTKVGTDAHLSGTASDPDGDAVQIRWLRSVISGGSLASCTFSGPTAFAPISAAGLAPTLNCTQAGEYLLQLVASDGTSSFDSVGASVTFTPNHAPVVDSGPSVSVPAGTDAQLYGSASDPDGDALEIRWLRSVVSGGSLASCTFSGPTSFEPLTAAGLAPTLNCTQPGEYLMQLLAGDGELPDDDIGALVTFTAPVNHPPVADSGPDVSAVVGGIAQLAGSVSDPDGDALEIRWIRTVVSGASLANCTFSGPTSFQPVTAAGLAPTMTCSQPGEYLLQLVVGDGSLSDDDTGALVTFTPALDLTAAVCTVVTPPRGGPVIRVADPQSGIASVHGVSVLNTTFRPASATYRPPVPSTDLSLGRSTLWLPGLGYVTHTNGAGKSGVCLVAISARGAVTVSKTTLPLPFSLP